LLNRGANACSCFTDKLIRKKTRNAETSPSLFQIRKTKRVSIFPVGLVSGAPVSAPIVEDGELNGFYVGWDGNRKFPVDMAGFAFSVRHFKEVCFKLV
jgi:hypothetical protein